MAYPESKHFPDLVIDKVKEIGASILPLKPNMMSVVSNNLRGVARDKDYQQLPYAFDCPEYHETEGF